MRLITAASDGDKRGIRRWLDQGVDVDSRDWDNLTPLIAASSQGHLVRREAGAGSPSPRELVDEAGFVASGRCLQIRLEGRVRGFRIAVADCARGGRASWFFGEAAVGMVCYSVLLVLTLMWLLHRWSELHRDHPSPLESWEAAVGTNGLCRRSSGNRAACEPPRWVTRVGWEAFWRRHSCGESPIKGCCRRPVWDYRSVEEVILPPCTPCCPPTPPALDHFWLKIDGVERIMIVLLAPRPCAALAALSCGIPVLAISRCQRRYTRPIAARQQSRC